MGPRPSPTRKVRAASSTSGKVSPRTGFHSSEAPARNGEKTAEPASGGGRAASGLRRRPDSAILSQSPISLPRSFPGPLRLSPGSRNPRYPDNRSYEHEPGRRPARKRENQRPPNRALRTRNPESIDPLCPATSVKDPTADSSLPPARRRQRSHRAPERPERRGQEGAEHHRAEGDEHPEAHPGRQGPGGGRRHRDAQAGADLPDPEGADRAERVHLLGRRARGAARRVRLPAGPRTTTTCRAPTTSTSRPRRSASSTCRPATRSPGRSGRRRKGSATSRSSRSRRSTSRRPTRPATSCSSRTSPRSIRWNASGSRPTARTSPPGSWT